MIRRSDDYAGDMITVARDLTPTDAHMLCACLAAAGVPATVADANLVQANALWSVAVGGAKLRVAAAHVDEAKQVIAAFERGEFALDDDFDPAA
ncbi:hypothetical protein QTH89_22625 [Variovorax sp. J22G21]|uniref:hypothetical protein n=1 Tax=Variovorax fucosicus TaxID=3053517 RepID=UPI0025785638|nr:MULTISPECIES: hypothetical protein [unclassified Variovorax]MDM0039248.1 hypothetical protein [Variovorax sp. J22R193]MDM0055148.1 hypothetical protein [Variovorax sp. J22G47]MDM0064024.1 hypothetical protein [Variovorax sp. J22G21]